MNDGALKIAFKDIISALYRYHLFMMLGWQDVRQRYRRSTLGPFWLTLSMGIMIATIGIVFGAILHSPLKEFLPFLTMGMVLWNFIFSVISDGCIGFISAEGIIKQLPIPIFTHILRLIWRNILIFLHNILILPLVLLIVLKPLDFHTSLSILGFLLLVFNLTWMSLLLATLCARYRDFPQIVTSLLQVIFYLTPIMWMPHFIQSGSILYHYLLNFNPFFNLIEIVRAPILGQYPTAWNWYSSLGFGLFGWLLTLVIYGKYKHRVAYWL